MGYCTSCGHELGVGRFCTNCGHPVDAPSSRYPLFADEVVPEVVPEVVAEPEREGAPQPEPLELAPPPRSLRHLLRRHLRQDLTPQLEPLLRTQQRTSATLQEMTRILLHIDRR